MIIRACQWIVIMGGIAAMAILSYYMNIPVDMKAVMYYLRAKASSL